TQLVFAIVGLALLFAAGRGEGVAWPIALGIAVAIPALAGFFMIQGARGQALVRRLLNAVAGDRNWAVFGALDELFAQLNAFYARRRGLLRSGLWHLAVWFVGAAEVWVVLDFIGHPVSIEQAIVIESLM